jgi:hypothetical protein
MRDKTLREQWADIDFDAVGLWRHLCRWDYRRAALGLLQDLFDELHGTEHMAEPRPQVMQDGNTLDSHLVAAYRERLMEVLGDEDGQLLKEWQQAFAELRSETGVGMKDRELLLLSEFLRASMNLVRAESRRLQAEARAEDGE